MSATQGPHSLAFRVMRLCKPSFHVDPPLRLDPLDLLAGEDFSDDPSSASLLRRLVSSAASAVDSDLSYSNRFLLSHPTDPIGLSGLLLLPQSFGAIYLGETFCSYISINNSSTFEVRDVVIKAEIQTERQRILLLDTSKSPVESIRAGGRYDFIVEHDVKELGAHTLVCSALYNDGDGERKYLPQFFKFVVANPLSVRTKVRVVKETTFLEACIENHTKSTLYMDQVDFEPAKQWSAVTLHADDNHSTEDFLTSDPSGQIHKPPVLIRSGGGIHNYLYKLKPSSDVSGETKVHGSNVLGKLQITWRTNLGEPGRLQTQQILGAPVTHKEIDMCVLDVPAVIYLNRPFPVHLNLRNLTDRLLGPFEVSLSHNESQVEKAVAFNGLQTMTLPRIEAFGSSDLQLNLIATKLGVQKIAGITAVDTREKRTYELVPDIEIFVDSE
ncbi:PREDICTED: trafficking protein particle complex subunit 13 [Tarenaya hassleriana]|uniref:trafficking protein particle complex subunit 13 n=1 Tax=Tarenaya hassleriana TaxID=28532 RepID=UPI00053C769B|nr:PREDICTED: trafficking protein particle complex subunit 13 [Tarenaya hassleriana]XP_010545060.1 PREDICTED: trafficking protein particle complex subunit 13 [Tarenaya hassleriana]